MGSKLRRLRQRAQRQFSDAPEMRVVGYGSPGVVKVAFSHPGPRPGLYPKEALGLAFAGAEPPITHVEILEQGADHG